MSEKLLPCPWCGHAPNAESDPGGSSVWCSHVPCFSADAAYGATDEEAARAWNRRSLSAAVEVVREALGEQRRRKGDRVIRAGERMARNIPRTEYEKQVHGTGPKPLLEVEHRIFLAMLDALTSTESEDA